MNRREIFDISEVSKKTSRPSSIHRRTDWSIEDLADDQIDTSDIPEWTEENWARAKQGNIHTPRKIKSGSS